MRIRILYILIIAFLFFPETGQAQHQEIAEKPGIWNSLQHKAEDSATFLHALKAGETDVHLRYFFMATDNAPGLSSYFANALGGGLRYETAPFHGFQAAASGIFIFNIGSSDLTEPDTTTGQYNRYEVGLFDMEDPGNKRNIVHLDELYLKYNFLSSHINFGRLFLNTPFLNLQDGRMSPTAFQGLWMEINEVKKLKLEAGLIYRVSPRSTVGWYKPGESMGIYPNGVNTDGSKAAYGGNTDSKFLVTAGLTWQPNRYIKLQGWELFSHRVFNTLLLQADLQYPFKGGSALYAGGQFIRQDAVQDGGNADPALTYTDRDASAMVYGARLGWKAKTVDLSLNYTRISDQGRYLMPREWGRDPFYTFLPRERNEGYGDVHAVMGKVNYNISKIRLKLGLAAGYYRLPDVRNFSLNKYGMPSYTQLNGEIRYTFPGKASGLDLQVLIAGKIGIGETYNNAKFVINKVDMVNYNLVLNYHF